MRGGSDNLKHSSARGKLFFRFISSYLLVFLVPLSCIGAFYVTHFYKAFENEILANVNKDLVNITTRLDTELSIFKSTVRQIETSQQISSLTSEFNVEQVNNAKYVLSNFSVTNSFVSDIFLVLPEMGYILTSSSSNKLSYFTQRYYQIEGVSSDELTSFLTSPTPEIMSSQKLNQFMFFTQDVLLFSYPIYVNSFKQTGNLIFQVAFENVETLFNDALSAYSATSFLLNDNYNLIAQINSTPYLSDWVADFPNDPSGIDKHLKALTSKYYVCHFSSPKSAFASITLIPRNQHAFSQITKLNFVFFISLVAASVFSVVAIIYAMRFNYLPLQKLHKKAGLLSKTPNSKDEISDIETALDLLSVRTIYLEKRLENTAVSVKNARLQKLLVDGYASVQDFNLDCQELDMNFSNDRLIVTTSYIHNKLEDGETIAQNIKEFLSNFMDSHYLKSIDNQKLVFVHSLHENYCIEDLVAEYTRLHVYLSKEKSFMITTGIGTLVDNTDKISQSYLNSSVALDYRFVKGNGKIICFSEIEVNTPGTYPQHLFDKLKNALQTNNETRINNCISDIIKNVEDSNAPLSYARGICFDLVNTVTNRKTGEDDSQDFIPINLFAFSEIETIHDIVAFLMQWQQEGLPLTQSNQDVKKKHIFTAQDILSYMQENGLRCEFSLSETSEHFGMTLPKFSQFFKDNINQDALSYLIQIRMKKAASLLVETDLNVNNIAQQTGYYNTSSFIRRFKQYYGVTPKEYQKINSCNNNT